MVVITKKPEYEICMACGHVETMHPADRHSDGKCVVENCNCPSFLPASPADLQTCPMRAYTVGAVDGENLDHWSRARWSQHYTAKWPGQYERPRACSFCGSLHPDDALYLLQQDWEVDQGRAKPERAILVPPGAAAHQKATLAAIQTNRLTSMGDFEFPVPPVKVSLPHLLITDSGHKALALLQAALT